MQIEHNFTVPAPADTVWSALLDPARIAPCFPGATLTSTDGDEFTGTVRVRLGPISLLYKGYGRFTEIDEVARRTVMEASGSASGGQGTAAATVTASLAENGESTAVTVVTQLFIMGKPAQFGRGMIEEVSRKIVSQFADCLARTLVPPERSVVAAAEGPVDPVGSQAPADPAMPATPVIPAPPAPPAAERPPAPARSAPQPAAQEIDLLDAPAGGVAKRVVPVVGGLALLVLLLRWLRRR